MLSCLRIAGIFRVCNCIMLTLLMVQLHFLFCFVLISVCYCAWIRCSWFFGSVLCCLSFSHCFQCLHLQKYCKLLHYPLCTVSARDLVQCELCIIPCKIRYEAVHYAFHCWEALCHAWLKIIYGMIHSMLLFCFCKTNGHGSHEWLSCQLCLLPCS